jgi:hypothetical protein
MTACCHRTCCLGGGRVRSFRLCSRGLQGGRLSGGLVDVKGAPRWPSGTRPGRRCVLGETVFWSSAVLWRRGAGRAGGAGCAGCAGCAGGAGGAGGAASRPALLARTQSVRQSRRQSWRRAARMHSTAYWRSGGGLYGGRVGECSAGQGLVVCGSGCYGRKMLLAPVSAAGK